MKSITTYITEKMIYNKANASKYKYHPQTTEELQELIEKLIKERGNEGDFNDIDTSKITNMSDLFEGMTKFNGNISNWDVSNVTDMTEMFYNCNFNQDISKWKINPNCDTNEMFTRCHIKDKYKPFQNGERL